MNILLEDTSASHLVSKNVPFDAYHRLPPPVFEAPPASMQLPDWSHLQNLRQVKTIVDFEELTSGLIDELRQAKVYCGTLEAIVASGNAQLILTGLENDRLRMALHSEMRKGAKTKDRGRFKAGVRHLTDADYREKRREEKREAEAEQRRKRAGKKAKRLQRMKKEWRAKDVAERRTRRAKQMEEHKRLVARWVEAGALRGGKPSQPKAPERPKTPDDAIFGIKSDDDDSIIIEGDVGSDEDEEDDE
ncbi:hypothetical protein FRC02_002367 [Tulasnella sp. 418]|nr:hypothetical protein FRC02_002367 [Tulasnella sp. 418]